MEELIRLAENQQDTTQSKGTILGYWLQVYDRIQQEDTHPYLTKTCIAIADIYREEALNQQALPYYLQAVQTVGNSPKTEQSIQEKIALTYTELAKPDSAAYYYKLILQQKETGGNVNGQINTLQDIAKAYRANSDYDKALDYYLQIEQLMTTHRRPNEEQLLVYNNIGYSYNQLKQYQLSISTFEKALRLVQAEDLATQTILHTNIGIAYYNLGQFANSIEHILEARKLKKRYAPNTLEEIDQLLATIYFQNKDLHNAMIHADQAKATAMSNKNQELLIDAYYTSALIHSALYEYEDALEYYQKHLTLRDSFALQEKIRQQQLLQQQINLERIEKQVKLFLINEDVKNLEIAQLKTKAENQALAFQNKEAQLLTEQKEKEILQKDNELQASKLRIKDSEAKRALQQLELTRQKLLTSQQEQEVAALQQKEQLQQLELKNKEGLLLREQNEKKILLRDNEISALELQKQRERENFLYGIGGLMTLVLLTILVGLIYTQRLNRQLTEKNIAIQQQREEIDLEKKKSDNLLLNILPAQIATELKDTGKATTRKYENVTILFTDFQGFTALVATIPARVLVQELNDIFSHFDDIMETFQIEKIETIGDAYMAACGLPEENPNHAIRCVRAAHEMLNYLDERNKQSKIQWKMRVGIHSGPVVAGVVGKKKFAYDLFGDTVNTASRIESNGEAGRINISQSTYELIKDVPAILFENRGQINAKGKGLINMWFVGV